MNIIGTVAEIDPKEGKNGQIWLLKFKLVALDGSSHWLGAYVDRKDSPKAFVQRAMAEDSLPQEQRTVWDVEAEEKEERGYTNLYVTSAKSSTNGHAPAAAATDTPAPLAAATRAAFPSDKDSLIVAQCAAKIAGLLSNHDKAERSKVMEDIDFYTLPIANRIVDTARALREVPAKEEPVKAKEDSLFDEEPL